LIAAGLVLTGVAALWTDTPAAIFLYAPLPFLIWAAVRFGMGMLCLSILLSSYLIFLDASGGQGLFTAQSPAENMLSLQLFLITIFFPLIFLAALIQERRDKEGALLDSEARYRALVMAGADMVWRADAEGEVSFTTQVWQDLTGQSDEQTRGLGWLEAVHRDDRERSRLLWEQAICGKRAYEDELRIRTRNWGYRYFHVRAVPILAPDGSVHEWVGANTDITDRKRAEARLRAQYAITRALAESASIADAAAQILQSICEIFDWKLGEFWWVNTETSLLTFLKSWHFPSEVAEFASASAQFTLPRRQFARPRLEAEAMDTQFGRWEEFARASLAQRGLRSSFSSRYFGEAVGRSLLRRWGSRTGSRADQMMNNIRPDRTVHRTHRRGSAARE
jgi:PAS domain S-box-containing protein